MSTLVLCFWVVDCRTVCLCSLWGWYNMAFSVFGCFVGVIVFWVLWFWWFGICRWDGDFSGFGVFACFWCLVFGVSWWVFGCFPWICLFCVIGVLIGFGVLQCGRVLVCCVLLLDS